MNSKDYVLNISPYALLDGIQNYSENHALEQHDKERFLELLSNINAPNHIFICLEDLIQAIAVNHFCKGVKMGFSLSQAIYKPSLLEEDIS